MYFKQLSFTHPNNRVGRHSGKCAGCIVLSLCIEIYRPDMMMLSILQGPHLSHLNNSESNYTGLSCVSIVPHRRKNHCHLNRPIIFLVVLFYLANSTRDKEITMTSSHSPSPKKFEQFVFVLHGPFLTYSSSLPSEQSISPSQMSFRSIHSPLLMHWNRSM